MVQASVFSGIEGFGLAAEWMGWETAFYCEIDEFCIPILKYYFPNSEHYADITKTDFTKWRGKIDILTGGFPCQPFSVAGDRKGKDDHRYLWPENYRAIREVRPPWFIGENVGGIVSMVQPGSEVEVESQASLFEENYTETILEQEYVIETICRDLEDIGYSVQPLIIPACAIGANHRRDRIWIIAHCPDARTENMQFYGENGAHEARTTSYANGHDAGRYQYGQTGRTPETNQEEQKEWEWVRTNIERIGKKGITANSGCKQSKERTSEGVIQDREKNGSRLDSGTQRSGNIRYASDPNNINGNVGGLYTSKVSQFEKAGLLRNRPDWGSFPTQPPICCGNDGLSSILDTATLLNGRHPRQPFKAYGKWRKESVKCFGNAIVPQVYLEICKAIEIVERSSNT